MRKRARLWRWILGAIVFSFSVALASHSADLNGDGQVNQADLTILISQWRGTGGADLNHDGQVNARDAGILFSFWSPRDPLRQPFGSNSIWNLPIGAGAVYV